MLSRQPQVFERPVPDVRPPLGELRTEDTEERKYLNLMSVQVRMIMDLGQDPCWTKFYSVDLFMKHADSLQPTKPGIARRIRAHFQKYNRS